MSEKRRGLFNRMFSPNGDDGADEPTPDEVRRWLNEPDGRGPRYRPQRPYEGGSSSRPAGLGGQQQAFRDLAAGFSRGQPGGYEPPNTGGGATPALPEHQWNPRPPARESSPPAQGGWTPPQQWTPPQPGGWGQAQDVDDDDDDEGGVEVGDVGPGGPLAQAGVRAGDIIVAVDGNAVDDEEDLFAALGSLMPGRSAVLEIVRGDSRMTTVVIAPR